uniref:Uncharacterized protein n=1 Tax=Octopus bimaculoides TaxID=37653 RepID=A0A0L8H5Q4_OCTBM
MDYIPPNDHKPDIINLTAISTKTNELIEHVHKHMDINESNYVTPTTNIPAHIKISKATQSDYNILKSRYPQFVEDFQKDLNVRLNKELLGKNPHPTKGTE